MSTESEPTSAPESGVDTEPEAPTARLVPAVSLVSLVNDPDLHRCCVHAARAAARHAGVDLQIIAVDCAAHGWNATRGLNAGIDAARHRWVLCIHQDVLLPLRWFARAEASMAAMAALAGRTGERTASPAVWGTVGLQQSGRFVGAVRDPVGACRWGRPPARVMSLDEHLLLVDKSAGLRFDPRVPGFHCYGTDLAIRARLAGRNAAVLDAPVVHLSSGRIDASFEIASRWMLRRWGPMFEHVIPTPAATIELLTPTNGLRRRLVATHRRVARRMRGFARMSGPLRPMPRAMRDELSRSVAGLPAALASRLDPPGRPNVLRPGRAA